MLVFSGIPDKYTEAQYINFLNLNMQFEGALAFQLGEICEDKQKAELAKLNLVKKQSKQ
jgi:hypothetical protein